MARAYIRGTPFACRSKLRHCHARERVRPALPSRVRRRVSHTHTRRPRYHANRHVATSGRYPTHP